MHSLPADRRQDYLQSLARAAAPGASLHILAFAAGSFGDPHAADRPGPNGLTAGELRDAVSTHWDVDDVRPAKVYGNDSALDPGQTAFAQVGHDGEGHFMVPGFLISARKPDTPKERAG